MKRLIVTASILIITLGVMSGCGSQIGGPVYDDQRASVQNQNTQDNMNQYIQPSAGVIK